MANGAKLSATEKETVAERPAPRSLIRLSNVHCVPALHPNLISCSRMDEKRICTSFPKGYCTLFDQDEGNNMPGRVRQRELDSLYLMPIQLSRRSQNGRIQSASRRGTSHEKPHPAEEEIWLRRMGHASDNLVSKMMKSQKYGKKEMGQLDTVKCQTCTHTKQTKASASEKLVQNSLEVTIHANICGLVQTNTFGGRRYFLTMTATPHRYVGVPQLRHRSEAPEHMYDYIA